MRDQPSWTAQSVATEILIIANDRRYRHLVPEGVSEVTSAILKTIPGFRGMFAAFSMHPGLQRLTGLIESLINPNKALYLALRKHWIEEQVRLSLSHGVAQVVNLGAGFDTLAFRLHQDFSNVVWFEVDHPASQRVKMAGLTNYGQVKSNLQFLACDLSVEPGLAPLIDHPLFDNRQETLYIAEGLFAYLGRETTVEILGALQKSSGNGSCLLGTMNARKSSNPLIDLKLKLIGEPYRWGLAPESTAGFLREQSWESLALTRGSALAVQYLSEIKKIAIPEDEYLFKAIKVD